MKNSFGAQGENGRTGPIRGGQRVQITLASSNWAKFKEDSGFRSHWLPQTGGSQSQDNLAGGQAISKSRINHLDFGNGIAWLSAPLSLRTSQGVPRRVVGVDGVRHELERRPLLFRQERGHERRGRLQSRREHSTWPQVVHD